MQRNKSVSPDARSKARTLKSMKRKIKQWKNKMESTFTVLNQALNNSQTKKKKEKGRFLRRTGQKSPTFPVNPKRRCFSPPVVRNFKIKPVARRVESSIVVETNGIDNRTVFNMRDNQKLIFIHANIIYSMKQKVIDAKNKFGGFSSRIKLMQKINDVRLRNVRNRQL
jgi:hypothetical protein